MAIDSPAAPSPAAPADSIAAVLPPAPIPDEPDEIAKAGISKLEWLVAIAFATQFAAAATAAVATEVGFHLSQTSIQFAAGFEVLGAVAAGVYIVRRLVKK